MSSSRQKRHSRDRSKSPRPDATRLDRSKSPRPETGTANRSKSPRCKSTLLEPPTRRKQLASQESCELNSRSDSATTYCTDGRDMSVTPSTCMRAGSRGTDYLEYGLDNLSSRSVSPLLCDIEFNADLDCRQSQSLKTIDVAMQVEKENVKDVLGRLDSIRRLAGDAQVIRRKENREKNSRRLHIEMLHSLLLEEAEFNPQAVRQRNVLSMLEGINLHAADIFLFSTEEALKNLATGPSVKLRDAIDRPYRVADRLLVDTDVLCRILSQLETHRIFYILNKCVEYVTFRHTTYQLKSIEEKDHYSIKNASGIACYKDFLLVTDACSHCIWRVSATRATAQGNHDVELFAGLRGESGLRDGSLRRARFHTPMGIVVSAKTCEAFVVDTDNNSIRRIDLKLEIVSTIRLELSLFSLGLGIVAPFDQPKGICIINGDRNTFEEMEVCQQSQIQEYKEQLEAVRPELRNSDSSTSSEFNTSESVESATEEEGSSTSSTTRSSSAHNSNEGFTKGRGKVSFLSKIVRHGGTKSMSPVRSIPDTFDGLEMSLEQSLTYERLKKYTVLTQPTIPLRARDNLAEAKTQGPNSSLTTAVTNALRRVQSRRPSLAVENKSAMHDIRDKAEVPPVEVRLAVTSDHCVWFVNPYTGYAEIIAGHPMQYGYGDAKLGPQARFSSPKGILHIRSVLLVADYWNNVIRSVNLYTTQVDTIVDFSPQGPVAVSLSDSGVLYCLDSDSIHYANILRIMSTQRGGDDGSISTPLIIEDKWYYQTLFSNPRTRACSSDPSRRASAFSQASKAEVWDSYKVSFLTDKVDKEDGFRKNWGNEGSADFRTRLQAHLQQAVDDEEETNKSSKKRRKKKRKRKLKKSPNACRITIRPDDAEDQTYIDSRLLQVESPWSPNATAHGTASLDTEEDATKLNKLVTKISDEQVKPLAAEEESTSSSQQKMPLPERLVERSVLDPAENSKADGSTKISRPTSNSPTENLVPKSPRIAGKSSRKNSRKSSKHSGELRSPLPPQHGGHRSPLPMQPGGRSPLPPKSPQPEKDGPNDDHVQRTKLRLSQMEILPPYRDDLPMTLRDMGIFEGERRASRGVRDMTWSAGSGNYGMVNQGLNLNQVVYSNNIEYRVMEGTTDGTAPDAGTIMVSGGKAYYRERTGQDTSWSRSRRGSAEEVVPSKRVLKGEDEEGCTVNFVDLVSSSRRSSDVCAEKPLNLEVQDLKMRLAAIQTTQTGFPATENAMTSSRRSSRRSFAAAMSDATSRRASNQSVSLARSRKQSINTVHSRRDSIAQHSRRESLVQTLSRRGSRRDSHVRCLSSESRRSSEAMTPFSEAGARKSLVSSSRKISFSDESIVNPGMSRKSQSMINAFGSGDDAVSRPSLSLSRRNSLHLNIMPTLVDVHEEEAECDNETKSESSSEGGPKPVIIGGCPSSKQPSEGSKGVSSKRSSKDHTARSSLTSCANNGVAMVSPSPALKVSLPTEEKSTDEKVPECSSPEHPEKLNLQDDITTIAPEDYSQGRTSVYTPLSPTKEMIALDSPKNQTSPSEVNKIMTLEQVPFTRDIDVVMLENKFVDQTKEDEREFDEARRRKQSNTGTVYTSANTMASTYKVTAAYHSKTWRMFPLPCPLSAFERVDRSGQRRYPNTPLSMAWYEDNAEVFLFIGLLVRPHLVKIIPPKHHEPDKNGRFNVLPIDAQQVLLADEASHQIRLLNHQYGISKHLAGCGKRGYLDGPLETCRMYSPCSMTLDPRSHYIYVADRGNHAIRKIDLMSGLMSTVVGNGTRGNCDGSNPRQQALDSPFEVSFVEPHYLIISCADNSIRSFNLKTTYLATILVGS